MTRAPDNRFTDIEIINRFAISLLQQNSLDDLLWSMAANIGDVLGFEDCVIYLRQGDELRQKAAFGIKNPASRNIKNEITIRLGEGIVGTVAQTGESENIANLAHDSRYIHDEFSGKSELAVPLVYQGEVIGVLDSESSEVSGFNQHDVDMFESLANIASPRIASALVQIGKEEAETALREAIDEAERANRAKSEFLARMSHELKTPLNAILGFANLIKRENGAETDSRIEKILFSGEHLLRLINESLDVVRAEQNLISLDYRAVDLADIIADCVAMLGPDAGSNGITLKAETSSLMLETDIQRLRQILLNVVSNAIKYNRAAGEVLITARSPDPKRVEIVVEDTGIGMSEDELAQLFQPFTRFGKRQFGVEGHGIGLTISLQIVQAMGGSIDVSSQPGAGTRVTITLPLQQNQSVA